MKPSLPTAPPLWMLIVAQLDADQFDYRPREIAQLLDLNPDHMRFYCRALWPKWEGHYLLDFEQTAVLIYRICSGSRKLPSSDALFAQLKNAGIIGPQFPHDCPLVAAARRAILLDKERRRAQNRHERIGLQIA